MGLSVDLELACDNIEMNSKHKAFSMPNIRMDDKKMSEAAVAVDSAASTPIDANLKSPNGSPKLNVPNDGSNAGADAAEPEEGEILNSEEEVNDFEYEAISSDEEYTLRQKIEALEARNSELEKIHSISARSQDAYDIAFGAMATVHGSYKHSATQFVDEKCFKASNKHRKLQFKPMLATYSNSHKHSSGKHSMDAISSDDECIALSDIGNGIIYRENAKFYDRAVHHHHSSSSSRRRKHYREHHDRRYSEDERDTTCRTHAKRRGCDILRGKRRRLKPVCTSSDDDCFEVTSREELKVALNINDELAADSSMNRSTLLHKLKAIHNKSAIHSDQEDTAKKKSSAKKRSRNKGKDRDGGAQVAITDEVCIDERAIDDAIIDAIFVEANHDNQEPTEDDDGVDEAVSLEEQELRLIALKSAVMKKHEARKQRQLVLSIRAYSPTDSLLTPLDEDGPCEGDGDTDVGEMPVNQLEVIDDPEDNNNMDISPASSPESNEACQPMDMDLVSSNDEDSQSPVVFSSLPKDGIFHPQPNNEHYVSWVYGIPLVQNDNYNHFLMTTGETPFNNENVPMTAHVMNPIQPPFETNDGDRIAPRVVSMASLIEEHTLRARLIADLNCSDNKKKTANIISQNVATKIGSVPDADADDVNQDESLEADCLRSLLLSSIKHKKTRSTAIASPAVEKKLPKTGKSSESSRAMIDLPNLPKITSNLKEAVKRLQNKNKSKMHTESLAQSTTDHDPTPAEAVESEPENVFPAKALIQSGTPKSAQIATLDCNKEEAMLTPINEQKCITAKMSMAATTSPMTTLATATRQSTKKAPIKLLPKVIAPRTQTPPKPLPAKPVSSVIPVKTVGKNVASNEESAVVATNKLMARLSPVASSKEVFSPIASSSTTSKAESAKKSAAAAISPWKPVQKLIISLKADDSSTTDFEDDADVLSELETFNETNSSGPSGMSAEALRAFDNASPASIAMGSPSMAPCSPIDGENSMSASNDANEDSAPKNDAAKAPDAFQMKLDEYLKQVRAKTDATQDTRPSNDSMVQEKPKSAETTRPTEKSTIINLKQKTPVAVCHLPISAQLEYRRLINRMKILEKQKEQKSSQVKQQKLQQNVSIATPSHINDSTYPNIRVTLKNENRFIQTNESKLNQHEERKSSSSPPPTTSSVAKLKDSLKKKVLLKNTLNAAAAASNASSESNAISSKSAPKHNLKSKMPLQNETLSNGVQEDESADNRTVNEQEVTALRKTEAKVNAHSKNLLTELEAMLQLVCRTQLETQKQLELEQRLNQLRLQWKAVEDELKRQKKRTASMLPEIIDRQKIVEARKTVSRKMTLYCDRMGRKIFGDGYKYHCDMEDHIKDKVKSIQCKTKTLKTMAINVPELSLLNSVDKTKAPLNTNSSGGNSRTKIVPIDKTGSSGASIECASPILAEKSTSTVASATTEDNLLISVKNTSLIETMPDRVVQHMDGAVIVTETTAMSDLTTGGSIALNNKDEDGSCGKYRSPLDHMQNNIGFDAGQSVTDRNAIVCPFDLMGTCNDEKCLYRHLSS